MVAAVAVHNRTSRDRGAISDVGAGRSGGGNAAVVGHANTPGVAAAFDSLLRADQAGRLSRARDDAWNADGVFRADHGAAERVREPGDAGADWRATDGDAAVECSLLLADGFGAGGVAGGVCGAGRRAHFRVDELSAVERGGRGGAGPGARHGYLAGQHRGLLRGVDAGFGEHAGHDRRRALRGYDAGATAVDGVVVAGDIDSDAAVFQRAARRGACCCSAIGITAPASSCRWAT